MSRDALVIGINEYTDLNPLKKPANDAEAIAQLLETKGDFRVKRLPVLKKRGNFVLTILVQGMACETWLLVLQKVI